jgi:hypothetical protein
VVRVGPRHSTAPRAGTGHAVELERHQYDQARREVGQQLKVLKYKA